MVSRRTFLVLFAVAAALAPSLGAAPQSTRLTARQFLSPASPIDIVAARGTDRLAWIAYEEGKRNVYTAAAPDFAPVRLTTFLNDDGVDLTGVEISDDGSTVVFIRGHGRNRDGWVANPGNHPEGGEQAIWAASVGMPGTAWRVAEGTNPRVSPDGRYVLFMREGNIHRAVLTPSGVAEETVDRPFIRGYGSNSNPIWSPDGTRIAYVSDRDDHSYIAIYHAATHTISYLDPNVDRDTNPIWDADSRHIYFVRRPGPAFAQQNHQGSGGLGLPPGTAYQPPSTTTGRGGRGGGGGGGRGGGRGGGGARGGGAGQQQAAQEPPAQTSTWSPASVPGLTRGSLPGGHQLAIMRADVTTGEAAAIWHPQPGDRWQSLPALSWAGDHVIFSGRGGGFGGRGGRGGGGGAEQGQPDEWDRYYSLSLRDPNAKPVLLTTTNGIIEDATSIAVSPDGRTFYYCTNDADIDRRHIWAVPTGGGTPRQVTTGTGIETHPVPLASGRYLATISASWKMPNSVGVWSLASAAAGRPAASAAAAPRIVFPTARPAFPETAHVEPVNVITKPADGRFEIHNQLFLPKDIKAGEKRPAMIFVHGGPVRQMLLGYHYRYGYHQYYAVNQWLVSKGYVVLSVNYRGGVGYGRSFQQAPGINMRATADYPDGNSEYQDVVAGAKYLQSRSDVDPKRIGIYGLSYGGLLTAQALARNSDIFALGVDYAGVHLYGSSQNGTPLDPAEASFRASAISSIDKWKSPVLIIHGDDDRNVYFAQTIGLVQLLRAHNVYHELIVFPDDVHDSLLHSRWVYMQERMETFLDKFFGDPITGPGSSGR
jgi:dipeptidyl aminopeptidase/acylaminoacyl peptidase